MKCLAKITGVLLLCAILSCKKDQLEITSQTDSQFNSVTAEINPDSETEWSIPVQWGKEERPSHSVYYTTINAPEITGITSRDGLIRIFKKDKTGMSNSRALPFEETNGSQKRYWYYVISEGKIMISVDVYGNQSNPIANNSFKYLVIKDATRETQMNGISKKDLKKLSYAELVELNK